MKFSLILILNYFIRCVSQTIFSFSGIFNLTKNIADNAFTITADTLGLLDFCPFVNELSASVSERIPSHIRGQEEALNTIIQAVDSWEFDRRSATSKALVLAFAGPTGVGKTETALQLANCLLSRKSRVGRSRRYLPNGLLTIRGEEYSQRLSPNETSSAVKSFRQHIIQHLRQCNGNAVIVFDEIQKIYPGILDALMPGLDDHGYFTNIEKPSERFSTANVVFIFISDIGSEIMKDLLLQYNDRVKIPRMILRSNLKKILDKYWDHLKFGKIIHEVVPFLPLEEPHIRSIMESKLNILSSERSGIAWKELIVEESVINYLSGPNFITYENISKTFLMKDANSSEYVTRFKLISTWGGRNIETGGPLQELKRLLHQNVKPRLNEILHIGLVTKSNREILIQKWGMMRCSSFTKPSDDSCKIKLNQLYIEWCKQYDRLNHTASNDCETVWYGGMV